MSAHNELQEIFNGPPYADPGDGETISADRSPLYCPLTSAGAETRTVAAPTRGGVLMTLCGRVVAGNITITFTGGYDEAGDTTFTITAAGQFVQLVSVEEGADTFRWRKVSDHAAGNVAAGVAGVAAGYKVARGTATLDGSNPTTVATGLTTIVAAVVGLKSATAPGDDPSWLSHNYTGSDGNLDIYAWKNTGGTDPTLVASTNNSATVDWIAVGT